MTLVASKHSREDSLIVPSHEQLFVRVDKDSQFGERLRSILDTRHSLDANLILGFDDNGTRRTCYVEWLDGRNDTKVITIDASDGKPLSRSMLEQKSFSVQLGALKMAADMPHDVVLSRYDIFLPVDFNFRAHNVEQALKGEAFAGEKPHFIVVSSDRGGRNEWQMSSYLAEIADTDQGRTFRFKNDAGPSYQLPEEKILAIFRAGAPTMLIEGGQRSRVKIDSSVTAVDADAFDSGTINRHFALHQQMKVEFQDPKTDARSYVSLQGRYLGVHHKPEYLFIIDKDDTVHAIKADQIHTMRGFVSDQYPAVGRTVQAFPCGTPLYNPHNAV